MNTLSYKTVNANNETVTKEWLLVDAENEVLGRLASKVAYLLKGKHKVDYTPHVDCGDNIIIINAEKITLNGNKWEQKHYVRHSGYPGGQTSIQAKEMMAKKPYAMVEKAVKGMLMKNKLGATQYRNLYVYAGNEHPHAGQNPRAINLNEIL